ncbi:hypothetical protein IC620_01050 [Hazenella sp. IB182357]|uniref:Uncharacterized protein n=1 Tax=Polycladospora coralii TaxID=2771432 RepID=A0A926RTB6_9BACL|nr:hypothetical protein [Polycladospora coralii]MBD1370949.1 hypothetical protein [Polycladospora coralii]MBS7529888.1 hypothetical protein [Polycladospora coralii]
MNEIILVKGLVKYPITLDPSIWIIDDRKVELSDYLTQVEGLAVKLGLFLSNAEPDPKASQVICHRHGQPSVTLTHEEAKEAWMCFAKDGKPISAGGPALLYYADGRNKEKPIDHISYFEIVK